MTDGFNKLEGIVLDLVLDDYETSSELKTNISKFCDESVSEEAVIDSLTKLERLGLVRSFIYDSSANKFSAVESEHRTLEKLWWYATEQGKKGSLMSTGLDDPADV